MRQIGISVYPEKQDLKKVKEYLKKAADLGYTRVFTSLLQVTKENKKETIAKMKEACQYAKKLGYEVVLDVNPAIIDFLKIDWSDPKFFYDMGATAIRLDLHYNGSVEKGITKNKYGIKLEVNMSSFKSLIDLIQEHGPRPGMIVASHNFYPQRFTGLEFDYFLANAKHFKERGIRTSAFVSAQSAKQGPWTICDGLPTIEDHRNLPIITQAKHLWACGYIDDVMIANAFASDKELKALASTTNKISCCLISFFTKTNK